MSDKTKEEILIDAYVSACMKLPDFTTKEETEADILQAMSDEETKPISDSTLEAMSIYADQEKRKEAIAFQIWVRDQGYIRRKGLYFSRFVKGVTITDEGLYDLYLQSISHQ